MQYLFDILLARMNLAIVILLIVIYILRKLVQKNYSKPGNVIDALNRLLRKHHIKLGVLAIIVGFIHGLLSSDDILTFNFGTVGWVLLVLLGASWHFKSKFTRKSWIYYHRILAVFFIGILFIHIIDVGGFTSELLNIYSDKTPTEDSTRTERTKQNLNTPNTAKTTYKDGIYTGNATGYRPGLVVQVTISNGAITAITIISHNERDPRHYSLAMQQVPQDIIKEQSTSVDGIAGATRTSNGIKSAVNDALKKAAK